MFNEAIKTAVRGAISADTNNAKKWQAVGSIVANEFAEEKFEEVKAAFVSEVIIPAMGDAAIKAFSVVLARKGSTEYNEAKAKRASYATEWEALNDAKNAVKRMASTYRARIATYAWPKAKGEAAPRDLKTRFSEEIIALIKAGQKCETEPFDVTNVLDLLNKALQVVNK